MFRSSELRYLRSDVRANCEKFLALCKEAGLNVKVTETVRDECESWHGRGLRRISEDRDRADLPQCESWACVRHLQEREGA